MLPTPLEPNTTDANLADATPILTQSLFPLRHFNAHSSVTSFFTSFAVSFIQLLLHSFVCLRMRGKHLHTHGRTEKHKHARTPSVFLSLFSLLWRSIFLRFSTRRLPFLLFCVYAASPLIGFTLRYVSADSFGNRHCFPFENQPSPGKAGWRMIICREDRVRISLHGNICVYLWVNFCVKNISKTFYLSVHLFS